MVPIHPTMQQFQSSQQQVFRKFFPEIKQEITNKAFILIFQIKEMKKAVSE